MRRRKSHASDSEKDGRYTSIIFILKSSPNRAFHTRSVLPLPFKNLNYLQAKVGGAETRKFPPIPQIGGFRSSFDKHWYTLMASISLSKWKSPSKWNLLIPRELRDHQRLSSHHVSVDSISTCKSTRWCVKGGAQLIAPMCTSSESFVSPSQNAISLLLQSLASECSERCSNTWCKSHKQQWRRTTWRTGNHSFLSCVVIRLKYYPS